MTYLSDDLFIGKGNERSCYLHPDDFTRCVKVNNSSCDGKPEQSLVEFDYYRHLEKKSVKLDFLPRCHGFIQTNLGAGLVFDRVLTFEERSLNLDEALCTGLIDKTEAKEMAWEVYEFLMENGIALSDVSRENFILSCFPKKRLYLVDGVGSRNYDHKYLLKKRFLFLARWKTKRQWEKYYGKLMLE